MSKKNGHKPTQETQPQPRPDGTVAEPGEIPIPSREEVFRDLGKVARPRKTESPGDGEGGPED
jgi:hypothetical protein